MSRYENLHKFELYLTEIKNGLTWSKLCNLIIYLFTADKRHFTLQKCVYQL